MAAHDIPQSGLLEHVLHKIEPLLLRMVLYQLQQREGAAQLELSSSHLSECQDAVEQQEGQRVCECVCDVTKILKYQMSSRLVRGRRSKENPRQFTCIHLFKGQFKVEGTI